MTSVQGSSRNIKNSVYLARKITVCGVLGRLMGMVGLEQELGQGKSRVGGEEGANFAVCVLFWGTLTRAPYSRRAMGAGRHGRLLAMWVHLCPGAGCG